ncbi:hypothetical protein GGG16DRAFT_47660 [Schizophyllum commune]
MLRWGQSTVHRLGGGGSSSRFYTRSTLLHRTKRTPPTKTKTQTKLTPTCASIPPAVIIPRSPSNTSPHCQDAPAARRSSEAHAAQERATPAGGVATTRAREDTNLIPPGKLALYRLRHWISDPHHRVEYTPEQLYNLYKAVKQRGHLSHLSPSHFSLLLHIFGMQADAKTALVSTRRIPLLRHSLSRASSGYWVIIRGIVKDMEEQGKALNTTDLHWAMLANLSSMASSSANYARHDTFRIATTYYGILRHATPDPKAHLPYLHAVENLRRPSSHRHLINSVSFLLEKFHTLDDALLNFIWRLLLSEQTHSSAAAQSRVMQALRTRFHKFRRFPAPESVQIGHIPPKNDLQALRLALLQALHIGEPTPLPSEAVRWAHQAVNQLFHHDHPTRWYMLCLLAYSVTFDAHRGSAPLPHHPNQDGPLVVTWRTICLLDILARQAAIGPPADAAVARALLAPCWAAWAAAARYPKAAHELGAARAIVATFLRLAAWAGDAELGARCVAFARERALFHVPYAAAETTRASVRGLVEACLESRAAEVGAGGWGDVLAPLADVPVESASDAVGGVLKKLVAARNLPAARSLATHCASCKIPVPPEAMLMFGAALATTSPKDSISILPSLRDTPHQTPLLLAILRSLRRGRWERIPNDAAHHFYAACLQLPTPFPEALRYDLRSCIAILINSGCARKGMRLAALLTEQAPTWMTLPFCRLLVRLLIARREFGMAAGVRGLVGHARPVVRHALERYIELNLRRASASRLAMRVRGRDGASEPEACDRAVGANSATLAANSQDSSMHSRDVISLLQAGRINAARRLYRECHIALDTRTRTALGNAIIAAVFTRRRAVRDASTLDGLTSQADGLEGHVDESTNQIFVQRSGCDLVRNVARMRDSLVRTAGFVPDAVTTNLLLKALLRWRVLSSDQLVLLLDHLMRGVVGRDRPAFGGGDALPGRRRRIGVEVRRAADVGRDKVGGQTQDADQAVWDMLEPLPKATSFARHVRPMLKMFIKSFYQRGDWRAARMVWRVLKAEEEKDEVRRRAVEVARAAGARRARRLRRRVQVGE